MRLGVVRGISYGLFGPPDEFVGAARNLGAGLIRSYLYWSQVQPEPDRYDWRTVDALLSQLDGDGSGDDEEVWLTVCSSSPWATRQATDFLPPSPAHNLDTYADFVRELVRHCAGRVRYWQCDNEPSNTDLLWAGTAPEYVAQLTAFHSAVKQVDPSARVVLGGCGYDVYSSPPDSPARKFFSHLTDAGRHAFDDLSVNLYGDPAGVPAAIATARQFLTDHGYQRPVLAGEHGGPVLFEFPDAEAAVQQAFLAAFTTAPATQSTAELVERAGQDTPERRALVDLYERADTLPPRLRMLMADCPPELAAIRDRIACRQLVQRVVLAAASGVRRTAYWCLGPEVPGYSDPYQLMHLLFGKLPLLDYAGVALTVRHPAADTFALTARLLAGVDGLIEVDGDQQARAFAADPGPLTVAWRTGDTFDGENLPPLATTLPWPLPTARVTDAFGAHCIVETRDGQLPLALTVTPVFVTPA